MTGGIPFEISLPQVPETLNADLMTDEEIHMKLQEGFYDLEEGRVQDANEVFSAFQKSHS